MGDDFLDITVTEIIETVIIAVIVALALKGFKL